MNKLCQRGRLFEVLRLHHLQHLYLLWEIRHGRLLTHVVSALTSASRGVCTVKSGELLELLSNATTTAITGTVVLIGH